MAFFEVLDIDNCSKSKSIYKMKFTKFIIQEINIVCWKCPVIFSRILDSKGWPQWNFTLSLSASRQWDLNRKEINPSSMELKIDVVFRKEKPRLNLLCDLFCICLKVIYSTKPMQYCRRVLIKYTYLKFLNWYFSLYI